MTKSQSRGFIINNHWRTPVLFFAFSLCFGITKVGAQTTLVRFFCSQNKNDSIACHVIITDKNNRVIADEKNKYFYSYPIKLGECQQITCDPGEPSVFYIAESNCVRTGQIILIEVQSSDAYLNLKRRQAKNEAARNKTSDIRVASRLGQSDGAIEKSISF